MGLHSVRTHSGLFFDFVEPDPETVIVEDIARALSRKPRFNGHMNCFYSVAQHACLVSALAAHYAVSQRVPDVGDYMWAGLHHDDSEYVMADVPTPLKRLLPEYKVIEERVQGVINVKWGLPADADHWAIVKLADTAALFMERDHMIDSSVRWSIEDQHPGVTMLEFWPEFEAWDSEKAMENYLLIHNKLKGNYYA